MKLYSIFLVTALLGSELEARETKRILVTGGAGFIGSHVAQALLKRGDSIVIVDDLNDYYDSKLKQNNLNTVQQSPEAKENMVFYKANICDAQQMHYIFQKEKPEVICHLAARAGIRASISYPELYFTTNVLGTLNMLEMARKFGTQNFILASSSSVYGANSRPPFHEDEPADRPVSPYAATKRATELIGYVYHMMYHIPCTCLRFFTVYGPRGRPDMSPFIFLDAIYHGKPIMQYGDGSAIRDFTYIDDIVDGILRAIDTIHDFEIFNLGRGEPIILHDFIKVIEEVTQKPAIIHQQEIAEGDVQLTHADITRAREKLGYQPKTSIKEGIQYFYDWYKNEYLPFMDEQ